MAGNRPRIRARLTWEHKWFLSGSAIVKISGSCHTEESWLSCSYPDYESKTWRDSQNKDGMAMAAELSAWLNRERAKPHWLSEMRRANEGSLVCDTDGSSVVACGPMFDANPPSLFWKMRDDQAAKDKRARLIDLICKEEP